MKLVILYQSQSDHEQQVLDYAKDYEKVTGRIISLYDVNSREGDSMASLYDIVSYPAVLELADNGSVMQMWQGEVLPLIRDLAYYDRSV